MKQITFFFITFLLLIGISRHKAPEAIAKSPDTKPGSKRSYGYTVHFYDLTITIFPEEKTIEGSNTLHINRARGKDSIKVDLSSRMDVTGITMHNQSCTYRHAGNTINIALPPKKGKGTEKLTIRYRGAPLVASDPPWSGGFVWEKDSAKRPWVSVACQFEGASIWWPCKDTLGSEPDSMHITGSVPAGMTFISNGEFVHADTGSASRHTYQWKVHYPINLYNVTFYAGYYRNIQSRFEGRQNNFPLSFYVLPGKVARARSHFEQVPAYLSFLEKTYGAYPFPQDGYKLVQAPYWGMEHQTAIAYGHDFTNNPYGFDFIIVHETAHEYWGNSVSAQSLEHLWIHEAFATYTEALYVEKMKGYTKALDYLHQFRKRIRNQNPMLPYYRDTSKTRDNDIYFKGAWMLHTLRNVINNDQKWFELLKNLYKTHHHSLVLSEDITSWLNRRTQRNLKPFFKTYLKQAKLPVFRYSIQKQGNKKVLFYRWEQTSKGFSMPLELTINDKSIRKEVTRKWQKQPVPSETDSVNVEEDKFLIEVKKDSSDN